MPVFVPKHLPSVQEHSELGAGRFRKSPETGRIQGSVTFMADAQSPITPVSLAVVDFSDPKTDRQMFQITDLDKWLQKLRTNAISPRNYKGIRTFGS